MRLYLDLEKTWVEQHQQHQQQRQGQQQLRQQQQGGQKGQQQSGGASNDELEETLADRWAKLESDVLHAKNSGGNLARIGRPVAGVGSCSEDEDVVRVPLGEEVQVRLRLSNKLPIDMHLTHLRLCIKPVAEVGVAAPSAHASTGASTGKAVGGGATQQGDVGSGGGDGSTMEQLFRTDDTDIVLPPDVVNEVVLCSAPQELGFFRVDGARWNLGDHFSVVQPLQRDGPLLQRTLHQRANRERGVDRSLSFKVVPAHPRLRLVFEGLSPEVLQGQLLKATLVLRNEGAAPACNIFIKLSQPAFVFYLSSKREAGSGGGGGGGASRANSRHSSFTTANAATTFNAFASEDDVADSWLKFYGGSSTVMSLSKDTSIEPGEELRFEAWLRLTQLGLQKVSLLASYMALRENGAREPFGPGNRCRTSFISIQVSFSFAANQSASRSAC